MQKRTRFIAGGAIVAALLSGSIACSTGSGNANNKEQAVQSQIQNGLLAKQPIPIYDYSEYRETLTEILNAEAHGFATTSFFYNQGVKDPFFICPSLGFPIPSTAQLTNPSQVTYTGHPGGGSDANVVGQMDPTGVYTGDSTGTYVECVSPNGTKYAKYWEGFVDTIGGPAHWDGNVEVLDGAPTVVSKK